MHNQYPQLGRYDSNYGWVYSGEDFGSAMLVENMDGIGDQLSSLWKSITGSIESGVKTGLSQLEQNFKQAAAAAGIKAQDAAWDSFFKSGVGQKALQEAKTRGFDQIVKDYTQQALVLYRENKTAVWIATGLAALVVGYGIYRFAKRK